MTRRPRLVVITGATRGLGRRIADRFLQAGDDLVLIARTGPELDSVAAECTQSGRFGSRVHCFPADFSDPDIVPGLVASIRAQAGDPDILINNAAVQGPVGPLPANDWEEWQQCMNVCLLSPVRLCRELLPAMIGKRFGRIVNISGGGATSPRPNFTSYATAKAGLVRFSETLAGEVAGCGVTVNCVAPGVMNSALTRHILRAGEVCAGCTEFARARDLVQDDPHNEERAADLVHFLTTDACRHVNGKLISAVWDSWETLPAMTPSALAGDVYTLRRVVPESREEGKR